MQDVPLLLLRATPGDLDGQLARVSFIQRLDTRGGTAPEWHVRSGAASDARGAVRGGVYFYGPSTSASVGTTAVER